MTTEEREALIVRARGTVHPTSDDTNERQTRALLSALDEARGQLAALHGTVAEVLAERKRDEALVRLAIKEAPLLRDGYLDTSVARIIATVDRKRADDAEKGGA